MPITKPTNHDVLIVSRLLIEDGENGALMRRMEQDSWSTKDEIQAVNELATARLEKTPKAIAARYDRRTGRLAIDLGTVKRV